jgi:hypothetical protein
MKTYLVRVDEVISHCYEIKADSEEGALEAYDKFTDDDLELKDMWGFREWNTPWDVEDVEEEEPA